MSKEEQERGFTITDKRFSVRSDTDVPREKEQKSPPQEKTSSSTPLPDMDFTTFLYSISSTVLLHFGDIPDPITNKKEKNLPMVRQTISIIEMLKEKTKGNLTLEEENLIDNILYDLRMRYIREINKTS
jgi:PBP1b-binding outer membrane lipoprotein LpoB